MMRRKIVRIGPTVASHRASGETFAGASNAGTFGVTYDEYTLSGGIYTSANFRSARLTIIRKRT
jgi:hypothetical protein